MKKWFINKYYTLRYYLMYYTVVIPNIKKDKTQTQVVNPNSIGIQAKGSITINGIVVKPKDE